MKALAILVLLVHLIGFALAVGAATVKLSLVIRLNKHPEHFDQFSKEVKVITRLIITGIVLLILSGIGWVVWDHPLTTLLIIKLLLVAIVLGLGPIIDNVYEPKLVKASPLPNEVPSKDFVHLLKQYLGVEFTATFLMYAATVIGVFL